MNTTQLLRQFPLRLYGALIAIIFLWGWYVLVHTSINTIDWSQPVAIEGDYQFSIDWWVASWIIQGIFTWVSLDSWTYSYTLSWTWTILNDPFSFDSVQILKKDTLLYGHYGNISYQSQTQTGLSQLLHQYFWLGDHYEQKRYDFSMLQQWLLWYQTLLSKVFTTEHIFDPWIFWSSGTIELSYTTTSLWIITWSLHYTLQPLKKTLIPLPKRTLDWMIFLDAFLWTWTTLTDSL